MTDDDDCPQEFVGGGLPLAEKKKWKRPKLKKRVRVKPAKKKARKQ